MKLIGISGIIGAGKTTFLNYLRDRYSIVVIEADLISKEVINDKKIIDFLEKNIPEALINFEIDRSILRKVVFTNSKLNDGFTSIIWPLISQRILEVISQKYQDEKFVVVEAAIIHGLDIKFDTTILLKKEEDKRIRNVQQRDDRDIKEIKSISEYQKNKVKDCKFDFVLENNNNIEVFYQNIDLLLQKIITSK